eukprot:CAMPEP_0194482406 /NCGR_PEP_ID=MMETSP0253-20130528/4372_1 /TAXON_ID=2966 /ORGANISM="Noctiluca scintillans" /LENGTH=127 /DNA_ID=CAMNT_0039321943 /DNA_START=93 /DNA_END=476 /DNA_ORIENTATION=+
MTGSYVGFAPGAGYGSKAGSNAGSYAAPPGTMPPIVGVAQTPSYVPVQYAAAPAPLSQSMSPSMVSVSYAQPIGIPHGFPGSQGGGQCAGALPVSGYACCAGVEPPATEYGTSYPTPKAIRKKKQCC